MEAIMSHAEEVLRQHPAPAMALIELQRRLHESRRACAPSAANLRVLMEHCPDRFRVVDPWRRPWLHGQDGTGGQAGHVLVISITRGSSNDRLRESVRWIARGTDVRSPRSVARLYALLLAEDGTRPHLRQQAA